MSEIEHALWATEKALDGLRADVLELESLLARGEIAGALAAGLALEAQAARVRRQVDRAGEAERLAAEAREGERFWVRVADRFDRTLDVFGPLPPDEARALRERHAGRGRRTQLLEAGAGASARVGAWWREIAQRRRAAPYSRGSGAAQADARGALP